MRFRPIVRGYDKWNRCGGTQVNGRTERSSPVKRKCGETRRNGVCEYSRRSRATCSAVKHDRLAPDEKWGQDYRFRYISVT